MRGEAAESEGPAERRWCSSYRGHDSNNVAVFVQQRAGLSCKAVEGQEWEVKADKLSAPVCRSPAEEKKAPWQMPGMQLHPSL